MFALSDVKRVGRDNLYASSRSASPTSSVDGELEAQFRDSLAERYGAQLISFPETEARVEEDEREAEPAEDVQEFEFRLFSSREEGGSGVQKILLQEEEERLGDGGFVRAKDPRTFLVQRAVGERKLGFEDMAVTGDFVLSASKARSWGLEVPWRVMVIKRNGGPKHAVDHSVGAWPVQSSPSEVHKKKKKPNKKGRILLRIRQKDLLEKMTKQTLEEKSKEEAEREKRARRNREKKVKRKMKEKAEKAKKAAEDEDGSTVTIPETLRKAG